MSIESLREYCQAKPGVTEHFPFDTVTLVFKVGGKLFALAGIDNHPLRVNLKCDPEVAMQLRAEYDAVQPGFHMNKTHWNTVLADGSIRDAQLRDWIDHSYELVKQSLPKRIKESLMVIDCHW